MTRDELIKRLGAATEGSRELDAMVLAYIDERKHQRGCPRIPDKQGRVRLGERGSHIDARHYTESLDAAMTLVPEGWALYELAYRSNGEWYARLWCPENSGLGAPYAATAKTGPLAMCCVGLRAREHA